MQKKWFKTNNNSIIDLNVFDAFKYENTPWNGGKYKFTVFSFIKDKDDGHPMAFFETKEEAQTYIDEIYEFLGKDENDQ